MLLIGQKQNTIIIPKKSSVPVGWIYP